MPAVRPSPLPIAVRAAPGRALRSRLGLPVLLAALGSVALGLTPSALSLAPSVARASGNGDHERARAALRAGEVLPLDQLLKRLQRSHPGQVLEVELERDNGRWIYEVKLLHADGHLLELELDARSAQVLGVKRKGRK